MVNLSADFSRQASLADGTQVTLRMVQPADREELRRQFRRLSPQARYRRFLSLAGDLSDTVLSYLTDVDGVNHVAIVATIDSLDLKREEGLGVGRFIRLPDEPHVAEATVTVMDHAQRKGLGRLLLGTLVEAARERGIHQFRATVLEENAPIRHLLEAAGATLREQDGDTLVFDVRLDDAVVEEGVLSTRGGEDHPLRRLLRIAAQSLLAIRSTLMGE
ncbi:uncharacterized protein CMC5_037310 [Chondromyces crocatus]|uniref:N-acetyltransferase domain-containing protein n=2 Tax=Chondromyces crocatus TaxID=52 RepID=A0A0K1EFY1_CHOCO|nr:uncharacterized protein CMC5_037310 [Chondromyces crocatus]